MAAGRAIVAHGRSFSKTRAKPAGGNPYIDGGETFRKETAKGAQDVTSWFLVKRNVPGRREKPERKECSTVLISSGDLKI